jgi:hypothetical protein
LEQAWNVMIDFALAELRQSDDNNLTLANGRGVY